MPTTALTSTGDATSGQPALLTHEPGEQKRLSIYLSRAAAINDAAGKPTQLKMDLLGAGLRTKTVLVNSSNVYLLQLFSDRKSDFARNAGALQSLTTASRVAIRIDFLRPVSAEEFAIEVKEAIKANRYIIDFELTVLLAKLQDCASPAGLRTITLLLVMDFQLERTYVYLEDCKGVLRSFTASQETRTKILSAWLGVPADEGLAELRGSLLQPVY